MAKTVIYIGAALGSIVGAYVPVAAVGASPLGAISIIAGFIGAVVGIWLGYRLCQWIEE